MTGLSRLLRKAILPAAALLLLLGGYYQPASGQGDSAPVSDGFSGHELQDFWRFFDPYAARGPEEALSSIELNGSNLWLNVPGGTSHDLWVGSNLAPRLLQPVPDEDFGIEVKFESVPSQRFQLQGVIVQEDDDTYLRMGTYHTGDTLNLFAGYVDGSSGDMFLNDPLQISADTDRVFLRVERQGDDWTFSYSFDGENWTANTFSQPITATEVGFYGGNHNPSPPYRLSADYFINLASPLEDIDEPLPPPPPPATPPEIDVWYTDENGALNFGVPGNPQRWLNVLGRISDPDGVDETTVAYALDDGPRQPLRLGRDRRLVDEGDFNIEIDRHALTPGTHTVHIFASDVTGIEAVREVPLNYTDDTTWPLPYTVDWENVTLIPDAVQVVDGNWRLDLGGIRIIDAGYDRLLALGEEHWEPGYEATIEFTIFSAFGDNGIGLATGWQGHGGDERPRIDWPLEAVGWLRNFPDQTELHIATFPGTIHASQPRPEISANVTYVLRVRSEPLGNDTSRFSVRLWPLEEDEPAEWDIFANVPTRPGSVLVIAHKARLFFGDIAIIPLAEIATPAEFSATTVSESEIALSWADTPDETAYRIERSSDSRNWELVATVPADTTTYIDADLPCGELFRYRMQAYRATDTRYSPYTPETTEDTADCPPTVVPTPRGL